MTESISRRRVLGWAATTMGAACLEACLPKTAGAVPIPKTPPLSAQHDGGRIVVRWKDAVLTSYQASPEQKYPYLYPLTGPASGLPMTSDGVEPGAEQRSLYFACDTVDAGKFCSGPISEGQILSTDLKITQNTPQTVTFVDRCQWGKPGAEPVMLDERTIEVRAVYHDLIAIDFDFKWKALQEVQIANTENSLFGLRVAPDLAPAGGGILMNSMGAKGEKAVAGKSADWCTFFGQRRGPTGDVTEGIAVFNYPRNPWKDCPWAARDYGFLSPTPFRFANEPMRLEAGRIWTLSYHVLLYTGLPRDASIHNLFRAWVRAEDTTR